MKVVCLFFILIAFAGCKKKYNPEIKAWDRNILVVEGNMDPGNDSTFVRLTRAVSIDDTAEIIMEDGALLTIEGKDNSIRTLTGKGKGYYVSPGLHLTIGDEYRLRIKTTNGEEYLSEYVQSKRSPPIDSLTWSVDTVGVHVYVHAHDPTQATKYYRWDCVEAWQIRMPFYADFIYKNGVIRSSIWPQDNMWECWMYDSTESLIIAKTERLSNDMISYKEIKTIPYHNEKVRLKYGILAKQYAIDEKAYRFFELMKENTERIGSLFSPQPFELRGNIRSVKDTSEYALGYITSSTVSRNKKNIYGTELTYWRPPIPPGCDSVASVNNNIAAFRYYFDELGYMPVAIDQKDLAGNILSYLAAKPICVDCRVRKAIITPPYFW